MKRAAIVLCLLIVAAVPATAAEFRADVWRYDCVTQADESVICTAVPHVSKWKRYGLYSLCFLGQSLDAGTTSYGVRHGLHEGVPWMRPIVRNDAVLFSVKGVVAAANVYQSEKQYQRGNPNWWLSATVCSVAGLGPGAWNLRQIHQLQKRKEE